MYRLVLITIMALAMLTSAIPAAAAQDGRSNPLAERLGGDREAFENRYGDPVSEDGLVRYEAQTYGAIDVLYHKGYVIAITLIADRPLDQALTKPHRADWTVEEARELALTFLPRDAKQRTKRAGTGVTEEGDLVGFLQSAALAKRFSAATYRQYEAGGQQGDCRYVLVRNKEGGVAAITVSLGNTEAGGAVPESAAGPSPAPSLDGEWAGITGDGFEFSFIVEDHQVASFLVGFLCPSGNVGITGVGELPGFGARIFNNQFTITTQGFRIAGRFTSDTSASGTVEFVDNSPLCGGANVSTTWEADRQVNVTGQMEPSRAHLTSGDRWVRIQQPTRRAPLPPVNPLSLTN